MLTVLSVQPPAASAVPQRDGPAGAPGVGRPPLLPPPGAETARALRPPDRPAGPADLRPPTRRERLTGPPPAFRITLLQHIRETALSPPESDPKTPGGPGAGQQPPGAAVVPGDGAKPGAQAATSPRPASGPPAGTTAALPAALPAAPEAAPLAKGAAMQQGGGIPDTRGGGIDLRL